MPEPVFLPLEDPARKSAAAKQVLTDLPQWFGIAESTAQYVRDCAQLPFWAAFCRQEPVGFIAGKPTSEKTLEIYVMGVCRQYQGCGIGTALFMLLRSWAKAQGYAYLQVKTVQEGHYDCYDKTNAFYRRLGFCPLECFPTLWDAWNPCQVYVLFIGDNA